MSLDTIKNLVSERYYLIVTLLVSLSAVLILSYSTSLILNFDISWLMTTTGRLFEGKSYGDGFFENTPPMIYLILFPPWLIYHYFHLNLTLCFYSYVTLLSWISCYFCSLWIQERWDKSNPKYAKWLYFSILMGLYIVPLTDYGQKDYLFWVFFLPYLFSIIHQLYHGQLSYPTGIFIGFWLFIGVGIKHFFLIPVIAIECFMMFEKRNWFAWLRPESMTLAILCCLYLLTIQIFFTSYFTAILPIALKIYYPLVGIPMIHLIFSKWMFILFILNLTCILGYRSHPFKKELVIFNMVLNACALIFLLQRTFYYYHLIPFIACMQPNLISNWVFTKDTKNIPTTLLYLTFSSIFFTCVIFLNSGTSMIYVRKDQNKILLDLVKYIQLHPKSFFINDDIWPQSPLYYHAGQPLLSYYPYIDWNRPQKYHWKTSNISHLINQMNNHVAKEIQDINPDFLIVNRYSRFINIADKTYPWNSQLNQYLRLSENKNFKSISENYVYHESILFADNFPMVGFSKYKLKKLKSPDEVSTLTENSSRYVAFKDENYRYVYPIKNGQFKKISGQVERYLLYRGIKHLNNTSYIYDVYRRKDI